MKLILVYSFIGMFCHNQCFAQENGTGEDKTEKRNSIALIISHTNITRGVDSNDNEKWLAVPSWGIDYNYELNEKWAVGLHTDIILEEFVVEDYSSDIKEIERSYPFAAALMASFKPGNHISFQLGPGIEFAKEENLFLIRATIEYSYRFHEDWELLINITDDFKIDVYNSWAIGLGIARKF